MKFFTLIFLFFYANLCLAFGLGDAELKSHLGEKLLVKINIAELDANTDSACFSVSDTSEVPAFKKTNIALKQVNDNYQLLISSKDIISEPIVNMRVSTLCDHNISRDYVLLIDPAPSISAENESGVIAGQEVIAGQDFIAGREKSSNKSLSPDVISREVGGEKTLATVVSKPKLSKTATRTRQAKKMPNVTSADATSTVDKKLIEAYTGKPQTNVATPRGHVKNNTPAKLTSSKTAIDKPYLVISGGNQNVAGAPSKPSLSLRLETQIDLNRIESEPLSIGAEETMDEVTVMTNRLAYLEKQITSLQTRNTQLVTAAKQTENEALNLAASSSNWRAYLLAGLGFFAALASAEWLRRRLASRRLESEQANWFDADLADDYAATSPTSAQNSMPTVNADQFNAANQHPTPKHNTATAFGSNVKMAEEIEDEDESILDHADVFIAHNRPLLAIQLLQNYLGDSPKESPAIWLKLLNLLANEGTESEYDATVLECKQFFNIMMPSFTDSAIADTSSVENYPHIVARLEGVWGSPFALGFLNDLIYNQDSQPREGFARNTFEELFFLTKIAHYLNPEATNQKLNPAHQHAFYHAADIAYVPESSTLNASARTSAPPLDMMETPVYDIASNKLQTYDTSANTVVAFNNTANDAIADPMNTMPAKNRPAPEFANEIEILSDPDETLLFNDGLDNDGLDNTGSNVESSTSNGMLYADEIDFPIPVYEIDFDSASEIKLTNQDIALESDSFIVQKPEENLEITPAKSKPAKKTKSKQPQEENVIEWDLPITPDKDGSK